jgi:hypothetical protein
MCWLGDNNYDEWANDEPRDSLGKWILRFLEPRSQLENLHYFFRINIIIPRQRESFYANREIDPQESLKHLCFTQTPLSGPRGLPQKAYPWPLKF